MKNRSATIILLIGAALLISGAAAFLVMSAQLSALNGELTEVMRSPTSQGDSHLDRIYTLTTERDLVASRIPWAIGIIFTGIFVMIGAIIQRARHKDENTFSKQ